MFDGKLKLFVTSFFILSTFYMFKKILMFVKAIHEEFATRRGEKLSWQILILCFFILYPLFVGLDSELNWQCTGSGSK